MRRSKRVAEEALKSTAPKTKAAPAKKQARSDVAEDLANAASYKGDPILTFATPDDFSGWLNENHTQTTGFYLRLKKKKSKRVLVTYVEAREVALCWGWIDGHMKSVDADHVVQRFSRRRQKSNWSALNKRLVEQYIAEGKMRPQGQAEIDSAKKDGRWDKN